jgi:hypothetical protein
VQQVILWYIRPRESAQADQVGIGGFRHDHENSIPGSVISDNTRSRVA